MKAKSLQTAAPARRAAIAGTRAMHPSPGISNDFGCPGRDHLTQDALFFMSASSTGLTPSPTSLR